MTTPAPQPTQDTETVQRLERQHVEHQQRLLEADRLMSSPGAHSVQRFLADDDNGVSWREFLSEIGGVHNLHDYLTDDDKADPAKVVPVIDRVFYRDSEKQVQGGVIMRRYPKNRPARQ